MALAAVGDPAGVAVLGGALDHCDDVLLCRTIIISLGKLRDRARCQSCSPTSARFRTGARWSKRWARSAIPRRGPRAAGAAAQRRVSSPCASKPRSPSPAWANPKLAPGIDRALRKETEPSVVAAGRQAAETLRAAADEIGSRARGLELSMSVSVRRVRFVFEGVSVSVFVVRVRGG